MEKFYSLLYKKTSLRSYFRFSEGYKSVLCELQMVRRYLTNWGTISNSIKELEKINQDLSSENRGFTKELFKMSIQRDKLQRSLGGISAEESSDLVFIIDTNYESLAIKGY